MANLKDTIILGNLNVSEAINGVKILNFTIPTGTSGAYKLIDIPDGAYGYCLVGGGSTPSHAFFARVGSSITGGKVYGTSGGSFTALGSTSVSGAYISGTSLYYYAASALSSAAYMTVMLCG